MLIDVATYYFAAMLRDVMLIILRFLLLAIADITPFATLLLMLSPFSLRCSFTYHYAIRYFSPFIDAPLLIARYACFLLLIFSCCHFFSLIAMPCFILPLLIRF